MAHINTMVQSNFIIEMLVRLIVGFCLFSVLLFIPAGTLDWSEAWAFLIVLLTYAIALHFLVFKDNPTVLKSRQHYKPVFGLDTLILFLAGIFFITMFILISLDVDRFQWSSFLVSSLFKYLGFSSLIYSLILFMLVIRENNFSSRVIEVQEKQVVISKGFYSFLRHPMYLTNLIFVLSIPLALGSFIALLSAILFFFCFILRILFKEKILMNELEGYKQYKQKVHYRVIPRIW